MSQFIFLTDEVVESHSDSCASLIRSMRAEFKDATVITIAHRLNTILDADKIIVLADGRLVEFGAPSALMRQRDGFFREMVSRQQVEV